MDSVIIYRSRQEAEMDEFISNNPELIVWVFYVTAAAALVLFVIWAVKKYNNRRFK